MGSLVRRGQGGELWGGEEEEGGECRGRRGAGGEAWKGQRRGEMMEKEGEKS